MMKHFAIAMPIAALLAAGTSGYASAQVAPRGLAIEQCTAAQKQHKHHSYSGDQNYVYRACMAEHGQLE